MSHLQEQLIKMGKFHSDLRPHIRPILASMQKASASGPFRTEDVLVHLLRSLQSEVAAELRGRRKLVVTAHPDILDNDGKFSVSVREKRGDGLGYDYYFQMTDMVWSKGSSEFKMKMNLIHNQTHDGSGFELRQNAWKPILKKTYSFNSPGKIASDIIDAIASDFGR